MRTLFALFSIFWLVLPVHAISGQAYMDRFAAYSKWKEQLPQIADVEFLTFIDSNTPLAKKLRERWLYQLARQKDWASYHQHYQFSNDVNLQCFAHLADYYQGNTSDALAASKLLWLTGDSRPGACTALFELYMASDAFDESLISQRIALALEQRNVSLARYLLKQYHDPRPGDEQLLLLIDRNPKHIALLQPGELHGAFYLYGLKRMVANRIDDAIAFWYRPQTSKLLTTAEQQSFLIHLALYKAMRNHEDANEWFTKIKPAYYTDALLDWQIRLALKRQQWSKVEKLIHYFHDKNNPCWDYWLARAKEETGHSEQARAIYETLASSRHYYGFLSSLRLNKPLTFQDENAVSNMKILLPYKPFTQQIKMLYLSRQSLQASRLLNDFVSELPKEDKSALIYWIAHDLQWHGKSVYLSSADDLTNQLSLRFPLPYRDAISVYSQNYQVPKALIYAIIRQESGFRDDVVSGAGAQGLMQIMPDTANQIAKQEKISYSNKNQLLFSEKNINIGVAYLKYLARHFEQHPVLMAAAYNAGPRQVNFWLKNHPPKQIDIWIETLPWHETRNYLKNVISFYAVYQYRMRHHINLDDFMKSL